MFITIRELLDNIIIGCVQFETAFSGGAWLEELLGPIVATSVDTAQYVTTILVGRIKCDN